MPDFELDPRLAADTVPVAGLGLSRLVLMRDRRWPWLILVPERPGASELFDLSRAERAELAEETSRVGEGLASVTGASKINVGALGNIVRQLHVHVIARHEGDPAWPGPVWGHGTPERYGDGQAEDLAERFASLLRARP